MERRLVGTKIAIVALFVKDQLNLPVMNLNQITTNIHRLIGTERAA